MPAASWDAGKSYPLSQSEERQEELSFRMS